MSRSSLASVPPMAVPDYETLMRPTLAALADRQPRTRSQVREVVAPAADVSGDDLLAMLPSGKATVFSSRVGWALTYMSQAGLVTRPKRGVYVISDRGRKVLDAYPDRVDNKVLEQFPEFLEFKSRRSEKGEPVGTHGESSSASVARLSPTEAIERLLSDADDAVAAELLDRVLAQSPAFLERLSLQLLQAMGYGGKEALLTHTGRPGDAGLDGIIRQDALASTWSESRPRGTSASPRCSGPRCRHLLVRCRVRKRVGESLSRLAGSAAVPDSSPSKSRCGSCF
jgi:restriction system protein